MRAMVFAKLKTFKYVWLVWFLGLLSRKFENIDLILFYLHRERWSQSMNGSMSWMYQVKNLWMIMLSKIIRLDLILSHIILIMKNSIFHLLQWNQNKIIKLKNIKVCSIWLSPSSDMFLAGSLWSFPITDMYSK